MFNSNLTMVYKVMFRILKIMCRTVMMACICFYWGWRCAYHVTTYFAVLILSCKRRRVDNLAHIYLFNWLVDWTRSLRNAVFALCLLKCVFIKMVLWFADLESSKLCPFCVSLFLEFLDLGSWEWPSIRLWFLCVLFWGAIHSCSVLL